MTWWTKEELLKEARSQGFELTERTFTNWVQQGLLAKATRQGRGPALGVASVWPEGQSRLLLKLLEERQNTDRLASLTVVPIGIWMYFGDDYVDVAQVMKAMRTWVKGFGKISGRSAATPAREFAEQLAGPDVDPRIRNRFVTIVTEFSPYPEAFDREAFLTELRALLDQSTGHSYHIDPEGLALLIEARLRATQHIDDYSRADFLTARAMILTTLAEYQETIGPAAPDFELGERFRRSPTDLATHLGMIGLRRD